MEKKSSGLLKMILIIILLIAIIVAVALIRGRILVARVYLVQGRSCT